MSIQIFKRLYSSISRNAPILPVTPLTHGRYAVSPAPPIPGNIRRPDYVLCRPGSTEFEAALSDDCHILSSSRERDYMRAAGRLARQALEVGKSMAVVGNTTEAIDRAVHEFIISHDAYPSPLNYRGFPKSCCTSVNEVIAHGIPDSRALEAGDLLNIDVTVFTRAGFHGDCSETLILGTPDEHASSSPSNSSSSTSSSSSSSSSPPPLLQAPPTPRHLDSNFTPIQQNVNLSSKIKPAPKITFTNERYLALQKLRNAAFQAVEVGIAQCGPGKPVAKIGSAIFRFIREQGFDVIPDLTGHGIGTRFHTEPFIAPTIVDNYPLSVKMLPGMCFTIEPVITTGKRTLITWPDGWTLVSSDKSYSAQFEHTIMITETGYEILTL